MRIKLIASLLVLCLTFSIGSALAQTDNNTNATSMQKTNVTKTIPYKEGVIVLNGNVTGSYNITGSGGGEQPVKGFVLIIKDLNNNSENVRIWDNDIKNIVFEGNGPLTPINVKRPTTQMLTSESQVGLFALADLEDFKCNMTKLKEKESQFPSTVNLTGSEMKVFGGRNDVSNFIKPNGNASECNLTLITFFPFSPQVPEINQ